MVGRTLGAYRVLSELGSGGMGVVYRATDTRLGRGVALKVLPEGFASDPQRMARFAREAQLLASLSHPHIATIYGLEESDGVRALAMELVEGPTLAERIAARPLPVEEALPIARQMAEALEYAHERGIIHRDLKPANVKLTGDGNVKILDFGLAKAMAGEAATQEMSHSPTLTLAATQAGVILGTAAYMPPEQAKGKAVDRRADIWSFGCVLYEMLTGKQVFTGETVSDTLAAVIRGEPDWAALPGDTPPSLRRLLRRCLEKDPKQRLRDIGEARIALEEMLANPGAEAAEAPTAASAPTPAWRRALPWAAAGVLGAALLLSMWAPWQPATPPAPPVRLKIDAGADARFWLAQGPTAVISPDGAVLAFAAQPPAAQRRVVYVRRMDQLQATALPGTDGARNIFFSPDGQWIAFFADGKLKKVSVTGGAPITLCDAPDDRGGAWGEDGSIIFAAGNREGLSRVSAGGGSPEPLTTLVAAEVEVTHRWPQVLPGGRAVLFVSGASGSNFDAANLVVQSLATGERKMVHRGGTYGRYLPSGHLVHVHQGTLFAAAFDLKRLEVTGPAVPVLEGLAYSNGTGGAQFTHSSDGKLVYVSGSAGEIPLTIEWMTREGKFEPMRPVADLYRDIQLSPDGGRLAVAVDAGRQTTVWVYDWSRETMSRLTFEAGRQEKPIWTPDGRRITYRAEPEQSGEAGGIFWKNADGTGEPERLTESLHPQLPSSWHPSGRYLAFMEGGRETGWDIYILPLEGDEESGWRPGQPTAFLATPFSEVEPVFSPDGRWIAYMSSETGQFEIYVRPFPGPGGKWQVSTGGGTFPTWSPGGRELYYRISGDQVMAVPYTAEGGSFRAGTPRLWSNAQFASTGPTRNFTPQPDGRRMAVLRSTQVESEQQPDTLVLVLNFFDELRRVVPRRAK